MYKYPLTKNAFTAFHATLGSLIDKLPTLSKFSKGRYCKQFENEFAEWHLMNYAVMTNSGSSANLALIQALMNLGRLKKGDRVGVNGLTWSTNVFPLIQLGLVPVPIDGSLTGTYLYDKNIKALFHTTRLGFPIRDAGCLIKFCKDNDIILIEDNCEGLGTRHECGRLAGTLGLASTCSFYVGHQMSTIEGGMVMTDDTELLEMLRIVVANGWRRDVDGVVDFTFHDLGYNLRPTEIAGIIGCEQMKHLDWIIESRSSIAKRLVGVSAPLLYIPISVPDYDKAKEILERNSIESRPIISGNITRHPYWEKHVGAPIPLYGVDYISKFTICIGCPPSLSDEDVDFLKGVIKQCQSST